MFLCMVLLVVNVHTWKWEGTRGSKYGGKLAVLGDNLSPVS